MSACDLVYVSAGQHVLTSTAFSWTLSRRLRLGLMVVIVTTTAFAAFFGLPAPEAQAFYPRNHERIVRDALPLDGVDVTAMSQIIGGLTDGAVGSDLYPFDKFRHFDSAMSPADICVRAQDAWNFFIPIVISGAQPVGPGFTDLANGPAARSAFGGLAHALADFYSHSNWIELNIAANQPEQHGPQLFPTCDPAALPAELHTGDGPDTIGAGVPVPGTDMNHFDLAMLLATRATTELYWQVRRLVASTVNAQEPGVDAECVARKLFQPDLFELCAVRSQ